MKADQAVAHLCHAFRREAKVLHNFGLVLPEHLVTAHAKHLTRKPWRWLLTRRDRQEATFDLIQMMERTFGRDRRV